MFYPGDNYNVICAIANSDGSTPDVSVAPIISIVQVATQSVIISSGTTTLLPGTTVYVYPWDTTGMAVGTYIAFFSAVIDSNTYNSYYLDTITLGDSRIPGIVAQDGTVAKDATVAKAATTLQANAYVAPQNDPVVLNIQSLVSTLPANPASTDDINNVLTAITQLQNFEEGKWVVDKVANTLTVFDLAGNVLLVYNLVNTDSVSSRIPA